MHVTLSVAEAGVTVGFAPVIETALALRAPSVSTGPKNLSSAAAPPPGEWIDIVRGGRNLEPFEAQAMWSGKPPTYVGRNIILEEYRVGGRNFDNAVIGESSGLPVSLKEFKWDHSGSIASGNPFVALKLRLEARAQVSIADTYGAALEWHVPDTQLSAFKSVVGKKVAERIDWVPYSLQQMKTAF
jgi:hypothetical protein